MAKQTGDNYAKGMNKAITL